MQFIFELSEQIFNRFSDKSEQVTYLLANRKVAMQQNNLFQFSLFFLFTYLAGFWKRYRYMELLRPTVFFSTKVVRKPL